MSNKEYFRILDVDKFNETTSDYTINEENILCNLDHNPLPQGYGLTPDKQFLADNSIEFERVIKCNDCGAWTEDYYLINSVDNNGREITFYVCNDCRENYFYCSDCGEYYDDGAVETFTTESGEEICQYCRYNDYVECRDCGEIIYGEDSYYCDECDEHFCERCWEEHYHEERLLYDYHEFNDWRLHNLPEEIGDNKPEFYIGHELEIDNGNEMRDAVDTINNLDGICMHDGSLSSEGIEFISHPLSYKYMLSKEEEYRKAFEHLSSIGYKSHNTSTCGLHFHVTRPENSKVIDRIILFMETYKEEIIKISRRQNSELNRWSRFLSDKRQGTSEKIIKSLDYIVNNKDISDRYMALNLTNRKTIEFRFFKGTLKYETFMADFEFINNLVHFASDLDLPIEELTWEKVVSVGKFLPQYVDELSLHTDKPIIDYSKEMVVEFNKQKDEVRIRIDNLMNKLLKRISNKARTKNNTSEKLRATCRDISTNYDNLLRVQQLMYDVENIDLFNDYRMSCLKDSLKYIEERVGE